ncbi:ribokinase [Klebsiella huaxiensis]|uniref:Ribokinase n=1 Tax=Klebsiella huaxiensis TaxID=2153354 RepID=A0A564GUK4_9ENTR|nr:ribokinase [Klebsiella huaxiensis]VUS23247.1 Ribokinase [Klebsiella huaxiensis]
MNKIAVAGSLHYDIMIDAHHRPEKGETVMGTACRYKFGGKGGNQAISAAKSGAEVCFAGAVGTDEQGRFLVDTLRQAGIDVSAVALVADSPSGMSVAISDEEGDYGAVVVSNANQKIPASVFQDAHFWDNVSMLVLQNEIPETVNLLAASTAKQRSIPVCINAAPARRLGEQFAALIDILIVNAIEARDMCGVTVEDLASAQQAATTLAKRFNKVIVTAGEHGVAWCESGDVAQTLPAQKVKLVSTHGAGDCFVGALCASLTANKSLAEAVASANAAAARHVSQSNV